MSSIFLWSLFQNNLMQSIINIKLHYTTTIIPHYIKMIDAINVKSIIFEFLTGLDNLPTANNSFKSL